MLDLLLMIFGYAILLCLGYLTQKYITEVKVTIVIAVLKKFEIAKVVQVQLTSCGRQKILVDFWNIYSLSIGLLVIVYRSLLLNLRLIIIIFRNIYQPS